MTRRLADLGGQLTWWKHTQTNQWVWWSRMQSQRAQSMLWCLIWTWSIVETYTYSGHTLLRLLVVCTNKLVKQSWKYRSRGEGTGLSAKKLVFTLIIFHCTESCFKQRLGKHKISALRNKINFNDKGSCHHNAFQGDQSNSWCWR